MSIKPRDDPPNGSVTERIDNLIENCGVKLHRFSPSGRAIWMVVGKDDEHWTDPELDFCSCKDFYFKTLSNGDRCYHIRSLKKAIELNKYETIEFDDSEYSQILNAILADRENLILRS